MSTQRIPQQLVCAELRGSTESCGHLPAELVTNPRRDSSGRHRESTEKEVNAQEGWGIAAVGVGTHSLGPAHHTGME